MEKHLATVWEAVADATPECDALVQGRRRVTWGAFDDRASRLTSALIGAGLGPDSKVAEYLFNCPEYLETYAAALKMRAVPVNVNYRYLDDELLYLLDNSEAEALVFHSSLGDRVARIQERARGVRLWVEVDDGGAGQVDGAVGYEDAIAASDPADRITRSPDDITMLYTGGTTGMPKGVMSKVGNAVTTHLATVPPMVRMAPLADPADAPPTARRLADEGRQIVTLPACPLMHGTGIAGAITSMTFGSTTVLLEGRRFDPDEVWDAVAAERVLAVVLVGDPFARPLLGALDGATSSRDLSSLRYVHSAGAMFSDHVKQGLLAHLPDCAIVDHIAASEGAMGVSITSRGSVVPTGRFRPHPGVRVITDDGRDVIPGSEETGMVAIPGNIPLGYFRDETKTASTFRDIDGQRYSLPGDWATVEADGSLVLLGRGSQCINTGGEKVFPEEVEEAVKRHPAVADCLVFGVDDERFGQRVVAVASPAVADAPLPVDEVLATTREHLAPYKVPRQLVVVTEVPRAANGKADYPAARELFETAPTLR